MLVEILKHLSDIKEEFWHLEESIDSCLDISHRDKAYFLNEYRDVYRSFVYFCEEFEDLDAQRMDELEDDML